MIPSVDECVQMMQAYGMLENIRSHSFVVAKVAHLLGRSLKESGHEISIPLVTAGALLHDIGKTIALREGGDHSMIGRRICLEKSMDEVAEIVAEHVRLKTHNLDGKISEKEIIYYSDKRVNHDQIVTLDERLQYILDRYGIKGGKDIRAAIRENFRRCKAVERKLFASLAFSPHDLPMLAMKEDIMSC